ncbi:hypothetical protein OWV82_003221 [Melia azedarach]|uniref:Uncharacterized protein n=1 Tax=Melia azedarach TaxID=155640 RepID=A0ACC1YL68_MELAZ|nr:hypothetical protein OWV82_003221 [Melia azedarach]
MDLTAGREINRITSQSSADAENIAASLKQELANLHPLSDECCIYRVPQRWRQSNEKAYTPQVVSIGPLHHGREELKPMEAYKRRYLQDFLLRTEVSLEALVKFIKEKESRIRNCYAEIIELSSDDFVKLIFVDAVFVIEVLFRYFIGICSKNDRVYNKPWLIIDINHDLWLLENQLPFFVLEDLFWLADVAPYSGGDERLSILKLTHRFCKFFWGSLGIQDNLVKGNYSSVEHLLDFLRISILPTDSPCERRIESLTTPSVMNLYQAGVKLQPGLSRNLFDIKFNDGILEIPKIIINSPMESLLRNLLAFEQCHCADNHINNYVVLINYLVNTPKDVELLVQNGIIENRIRNCEGVSNLFHNLVEWTTLDRNDFYFSSLVEDLNKYSRTSWHKWKATLKQDYFNTPWASISVIAAIILLLLTFIQAICSIIAL